MRRGAIGQIRRGRLAFVAEVRSLAHVLNQTVGRTFQHACDAELGDARCGVDLDDPAFAATGSVTAVTGDRGFTASGLGGFAAGWFALGRLTWTSGANDGGRAEVASHASAPARVTHRAARGAGAADRGWRRLRRPRRLRQAAGDLPATVRQRRRTSAASRTSPARTRCIRYPNRGDANSGRGAVIAADPDRVIAAARGWLGTPYHDQASVKGVGCDCLGLVRGVWRELFGAEPLPLPPYSRDWGETGAREPLAEAARTVMSEVPVTELHARRADPVPDAPGAVAKHCGIVTAPDRFIHAYERTGVIEEPLTAAWRRRVAFAFLFPAG